MVYELLLGLAPWDGNDADEMMEQIKAADVVWPPEGMVSASCIMCWQYASAVLPLASACRHWMPHCRQVLWF
jgi:hypothetical protein